MNEWSVALTRYMNEAMNEWSLANHSLILDFIFLVELVRLDGIKRRKRFCAISAIFVYTRTPVVNDGLLDQYVR